MALIFLVLALLCFFVAAVFQSAALGGEVLLVPAGLFCLTLAFIVGQPIIAERIGRRG
jgi:hypothetical protein